MTFYTLTIIYYKKDQINSSFNTNLLLFSDKYDIIRARLEKQKEDLINFIKEAHEVKESNIDISTPRYTTNPNTLYESYVITAKEHTWIIFISKLEKTEKTNESPVLNDFVKLKPEAIEVLKQDGSYNISSDMLIGQVVAISKQTTRVCELVFKDPTHGHRNHIATVPSNFLQKVIL